MRHWSMSVVEGRQTGIVASNGRRIQVRPLHSTDAPLLMDLFRHLGPDSRYLRFNVALPDPDAQLVETEARRMATVPPEKGRAWIALLEPDGSPVAGARYVFTAPSVAEASIVVRDDWQRHGVGTQLLRHLLRQARADGLVTLVATVQLANKGIWRLLRAAQVPYTSQLDGPMADIAVDISAVPLLL